jgi:arginyl-tRNA synthetase
MSNNQPLNEFFKVVEDSIFQVVRALYPTFTESLNLTPSPNIAHGDLTLPCFPLAKFFGEKPNEIAVKIHGALNEHLLQGKVSEVASLQVIGPYLNIFLNRTALAKSLLNINVMPHKDSGKPPILIDYSSPNIAKPFHVGHLRTTLIGGAIYRAFTFSGRRVIGINHLGDWGTQFGFVYAGCKIWGMPEEESVHALVERYAKASSARKAQEAGSMEVNDELPDIGSLARDYFIRLESGDPEATAFWKWCLDISVTYLKRIYTELNVHFDHYTGESFYRDMLTGVEEILKKSGILEDSRGSLGVNLDKDLGFVRIFAEDSRSLYITRDIACAFYRHEQFKPEASLYVVGAPQILHFKQLKGVLERLNHPSANEIVHIPFGNVPGMGTRHGNVINLDDFIEEATKRALIAYEEEVSKRPAGVDPNLTAKKVALGAINFYFLKHSNIKDFQFRWEEALNFQGDSGPYLQYTCSRLYGIERNVTEAYGNLLEEEVVNFDAFLSDEAHQIVILLSHFETNLKKVLLEYEPYYLANYLLALSKAISRAYRALRVIGEERSRGAAHLLLFRKAKDVLRAGMEIVGVPILERM